MTAQSSRLGDEGQRRRQEILSLAIAEAQRLKKLRLYKRAGTCAVLLMTTVVGFRLYLLDMAVPMPRHSGGSEEISLREVETVPAPISGLASTSPMAEYLVNNDVHDLESYLVISSGRFSDGILVNDHQLVNMLASLGRNGTVIRTPERVWLVEGKQSLEQQEFAPEASF